MTTLEIKLYKENIASDIMLLDDFDVLRKIKAYIGRVGYDAKKKNKEDILRGFDNAIKQYKKYKDGSVKLKTIEEVLDEL